MALHPHNPIPEEETTQLKSYVSHEPLTEELRPLRTYNEEEAERHQKEEETHMTLKQQLANEVKDLEAQKKNLVKEQQAQKAKIQADKKALIAKKTAHTRHMKAAQKELRDWEKRLEAQKKETSQQEKLIEIGMQNLNDRAREVEENLGKQNERYKQTADTIRDLEERINEERDKLKRLNEHYAATSRSYADSINHKMNQDRQLTEKIEKAKARLESTLADKRETDSWIQDMSTIWEMKKKDLDKKEKMLDNRDKALQDKYATLQSAIKEWKRRGVQVP